VRAGEAHKDLPALLEGVEIQVAAPSPSPLGQLGESAARPAAGRWVATAARIGRHRLAIGIGSEVEVEGNGAWADREA
jgi:hypothetical protein